MTLSNRDRNLTFAGILLAMFLGALDQTIVSTALPRIVEDLGGLERYAWVFTAYLVASTVLVPVVGKLADMYSRKTIELVSVSIFLAGSFLCGVAGEFGSLPLLGDAMNQLIVFRAIQGIGAAGLFSLAFIIIADLFPPAVRGKYQGLVSAVFGVASILGPLLGGFLTDNAGGIIPGVAGWRWVFYVNVPFGALAIWFIATYMPPLRPAGERGRLDVASAVLLICGLVPFTTALQLDRTAYPWGSPVTVTMLAVSVALLALFVWRTLKSSHPILDLTLFRNRIFRVSNLAVLFHGAAFLSTVAFLPLFVVNVIGVSATGAGLALIPLSLGVTVGAFAGGQLVSLIGRYRLLMMIGCAIFATGVLLISLLDVDATLGRVSVYMVITGLGVGPALPLYTLAVQNAVDARRIGQATSATQFFRQIGGAVGTAILGTVLATSLAAGFAANLGGVGAAPQAQAGGEGVSAAGDLLTGIRASFEATRSELIAAVEAGDADTVMGLLVGNGVPMQVASGVAERVDAAGTEAERAALASELVGTFDAQAVAVMERVESGVKLTFAQAVTTVYRYVFFIVLAALVLSAFIPVLTLKKTFDEAPAGTV
ncbi:MAG TPA: MDR family MFS transporter [Trueperaceae bacterium]